MARSYQVDGQDWVGDVTVPLPYRDALRDLLKRYMVPSESIRLYDPSTHQTFHLFSQRQAAKDVAKALKKDNVPFYMILHDGEQCYGLFQRHNQYVQGGWIRGAKAQTVDWQKQIDIHKQQQVVHLLSK